MKKRLTVGEFVKNNIPIISTLSLLFLACVVALVFAICKGPNNAINWESLVIEISAFVGTTFLGLAVFYNTQFYQRQKEIEEQINVEIKYGYPKQLNGFFVPYLDNEINKETFNIQRTVIRDDTDEDDQCNMNYIYYEVINRNPQTPIYVEPVSMFIIKDGQLTEAKNYSYYTDTYYADALDYKQKKRCYIGTKKQILRDDYYLSNKNQSCYVSIQITSLKDQVVYAIFEYNMGRLLTTNKPTFFTEEQYRKVIKKCGAPVFIPNS